MTALAVALLWLALIGALTAALAVLSRRPPRVTLTRTLPHSAFEGSQVTMTVTVRVHSRRPLRMRVDDPTPRAVIPDREVTFTARHLGYTEQSGAYTLHLNRRGAARWPGAQVQWADPFGLFWRSLTLDTPATHLDVYPGTHGLRLPDVLRPLLSEGSLSRQLGLDDPISMRGARTYVPGDPPGRVHWRLSARTGTLTVRELERTAASTLTVYVDVSGGGAVFVDSAARLAASLLREAQAMDMPVAVATPLSVTPAGRGTDALHQGLLALARLAPDDEPPHVPPTRSGGNLILLTASASPALIEQALRARATASRVSIVALPEGFYLEPGEQPRRQRPALTDAIRDLEARAAVLAGAGVLVYVLRGNQSVLTLSR